MIEIFKSDGGKTIIAICPDSEISLSNTGDVGLIVGSEIGFDELRAALGAMHARKLAPLTPDQKNQILNTYKAGHTASETAKIMGLNPQRVSGVIQGHRHPVRENVAKHAKAAEPINDVDRIIMNGRKSGHDFVHIANEINTAIGGHWLPDDVANRIKEMQK